MTHPEIIAELEAIADLIESVWEYDADRQRALEGLERAVAARDGRHPANFGEWIRWTFGDGIAELFLEPYNFKVWGYPPVTLGIGWMGDRVAVPDLERIRQNVRDGRDDGCGAGAWSGPAVE